MDRRKAFFPSIHISLRCEHSLMHHMCIEWVIRIVVRVIDPFENTSVKGSVSRLWTLSNNLEIVNANDQLCWIISIPTSPWRDTFGWMILVKNRTTGGCIGYLWIRRIYLSFLSFKRIFLLKNFNIFQQTNEWGSFQNDFRNDNLRIWN